jgi:hypothetical protein
MEPQLTTIAQPIREIGEGRCACGRLTLTRDVLQAFRGL